MTVEGALRRGLSRRPGAGGRNPGRGRGASGTDDPAGCRRRVTSAHGDFGAADEHRQPPGRRGRGVARAARRAPGRRPRGCLERRPPSCGRRSTRTHSSRPHGRATARRRLVVRQAGDPEIEGECRRGAVRRLRLDAELVRRGLARSREHASELIGAGRVSVNGAVGHQAGDRRRPPTPLSSSARTRTSPTSRVAGGTSSPARSRPSSPWASRWPVDAASTPAPRTGGFTDVLLRAGAREVVAVDVGYGQLAWSLQQRPAGPGARPDQRPRPRHRR